MCSILATDHPARAAASTSVWRSVSGESPGANDVGQNGFDDPEPFRYGPHGIGQLSRRALPSQESRHPGLVGRREVPEPTEGSDDEGATSGNLVTIAAPYRRTTKGI